MKIEIYDNGKGLDYRYDVVIGGNVFKMSYNPYSKNGVDMFIEKHETYVLVGEKIEIDKAPKNVLRCIIEHIIGINNL